VSQSPNWLGRSAWSSNGRTRIDATGGFSASSARAVGALALDVDVAAWPVWARAPGAAQNTPAMRPMVMVATAVHSVLRRALRGRVDRSWCGLRDRAGIRMQIQAGMAPNEDRIQALLKALRLGRFGSAVGQSVFAIDFLAALVAFLGFQGHCGDWACIKAL
jgi:hypothetical protein